MLGVFVCAAVRPEVQPQRSINYSYILYRWHALGQHASAVTSLQERHVGRMIDSGIAAASGAAGVKLTNRARECRCLPTLHMQPINNT